MTVWRTPRLTGAQTLQRVLGCERAGLVEGPTFGVDATTLEADAALRGMNRRRSR